MNTILLFEIYGYGRDRYAYVDVDDLRPTGHTIRTCGPYYYGNINQIENLTYDDVRTWLTEEEFEAITQGSEDLEIYNRILERAENNDPEYIDIIDDIKEGSKDIWKQKYGIDAVDCKDIFDYYNQDIHQYYDESIIYNIWDSKEDFVEDEGYRIVGGEPRQIDIEYVDVDKISDDLIDMDEAFYLLPSGKITYFAI